MAITQDVIVNTKKAQANIKKVTDELKKTEVQTKKTGSKLDQFKATAVGAFAAIVAYRIGSHLAQQFREAVSAGLEFSKAMGEIETLLPEAERNTNQLRRSLIDLSNTFGQDASTQARGFYDVVSAGVQGFNKQLEVLNVTNKVAIGGITDTATATNVLVTTMNAFEQQGATASQVADVLFTTVKQGVTTIPQLASSLGQVNAIASTSGVTLGEVGASMAVLTKNGLSTAESATALKSAIVSFSKPTKDAQKIIKNLGIDFSTAAIQQKGFADVLRQVREATQGNVTVLQKLFPNVRAQAALIPLLTTRWGEFEKQLENFNDTAGAADQAFERISKTASFQADRLSTSFKNVFASITSIIDEPLAHWLAGAASMFQRTSLVVKVFARGVQFVVQALILLEQAWVGVLTIQQAFTAAAGQVFRIFGQTGKAIADATADVLKDRVKRLQDLYAMQGRVAKSFNDFLSGKDTGQNKLKKELKEINDQLREIEGFKPPTPEIEVLTRAAHMETLAVGKQNDAHVKLFKAEQDRIKKEKALKLEAVNETISHLSDGFGQYKAVQIAEATIATYTAANKALATYPPPFSFIAAGAAIAAGIANVAKIRSASSEGYQAGGIVPGNQFEGDRVLARVNSGELILNRQQQSSLFDAINSGNLNDKAANVTVNVQSLTGDIPQRSLDRMIDQIRERVVYGNKRFV